MPESVPPQPGPPLRLPLGMRDHQRPTPNLRAAADGQEAVHLLSDVGGRAGYRDMEAFVGTVTDPDQADRLSIAISGRGAFRRFKDVLARWPDELERWYRLSNERERGRARAWLATEGFAAGPSGTVETDADDSD